MCDLLTAATAARTDYPARIIISPPHWGRGDTDAAALDAMRKATGHTPRPGATVYRAFVRADGYIDELCNLYGRDPAVELQTGRIVRGRFVQTNAPVARPIGGTP